MQHYPSPPRALGSCLSSSSETTLKAITVSRTPSNRAMGAIVLYYTSPYRKGRHPEGTRRPEKQNADGHPAIGLHTPMYA